MGGFGKRCVFFIRVHHKTPFRRPDVRLQSALRRQIYHGAQHGGLQLGGWQYLRHLHPWLQWPTLHQIHDPCPRPSQPAMDYSRAGRVADGRIRDARSNTRLPARRRPEWPLRPHLRPGMRHANLARCSAHVRHRFHRNLGTRCGEPGLLRHD